MNSSRRLIIWKTTISRNRSSQTFEEPFFTLSNNYILICSPTTYHGCILHHYKIRNITYHDYHHPQAPPLSQHDQSKAACPHCCLGHEHPRTWEPGLSMRKSSINSDETTLFHAKKNGHIQKFTSSLGPLIFQVPSWIHVPSGAFRKEIR